MKRTSLLLAALLFASFALGQNEKYYQKMGETLSGFSTVRNVEDLQKLANQFRVISQVEKEEWLPLYYEAQCHILISFMGALSAEDKDSYLDKAASIIEAMKAMAPHEAEIQVLEAFYLTGSLLVNPPQRAMSTTPRIHAALSRALAMEPDNPRARFLRISNEMGTASYFGDDTEPYCVQARELLQNWDSYKLKSPIHPNWGKEDIQGIVNSCGQ